MAQIHIDIGDVLVEDPAPTAAWDIDQWDEESALWAGTMPNWNEISCRVRGVQIDRGRNGALELFEPGRCTIHVDNADGWASWSPELPVGVSHPAVGAWVRVRADDQTLFTGTLLRVVDNYEPGERPDAALVCIDPLARLGQVELPAGPAVGAGETAAERIERVLDRVFWVETQRDLDGGGPLLTATKLEGSMIDQAQRAAVTAGGSLFANRDGKICYRDAGWLRTHPRSITPQAVIATDGRILIPGTPGTPAIPGTPQVDGYLTPTIGTVTTPDPGPLPSECTIVARVQVAGGIAAASDTVAGQIGTAGRNAFRFTVNNGIMYLQVSSDGTAWRPGNPAANAAQVSAAGLVAGADKMIAAVYDHDNGGGALSVRPWVSHDQGGTWAAISAGFTQAPAIATPIDVTQLVQVGTTVATPFFGRIYWAELRTGLDPSAGTVVWRFDANDYPGTGTSYVDPRGRTWTLTTAGAITPMIPATAEIPAVPGIPDVRAICPAGITVNGPDVERILNVVTYAGVDEAVEEAGEPVKVTQTDYPSTRRYGPASWSVDNLFTQDLAQLTLLGSRVLALRVEPAPRLESVTLAPLADPAAEPFCSAVELGDRLEVHYVDPAQGWGWDFDVHVHGISYSISPLGADNLAAEWDTTLSLDDASYWQPGVAWDYAAWDVDHWSAPALRKGTVDAHT